MKKQFAAFLALVLTFSLCSPVLAEETGVPVFEAAALAEVEEPADGALQPLEMPVGVSGTHRHCVCGGDGTVGGGHTHSAVDYEPWNGGTRTFNDGQVHHLYVDGSFRLTGPVNVSGQGTVLNLCLNGQTVTCGEGKRLFQIYAGGTVNLCDCTAREETDGAYISGQLTGSSCDVPVLMTENSTAAGGTLNLYGGAISGNTATTSGIISVQGASRLNMYGGRMDGNRSQWGTVYLIEETGAPEFDMYGGGISGNTAKSGGGVYVCIGQFNLYGGKISGNSAENGGGICMDAYSGSRVPVTAIYGGEISGNKATNGGGILNAGRKLYLYGGTITGNQATSQGGGVALNDDGQGRFEAAIKGSPVITDNRCGEKINNLYFLWSRVYLEGALEPGAQIGVTVADMGYDAAFLEDKTGSPTSAADSLAYFISDDDTRGIRLAGGNRLKVTPVYALAYDIGGAQGPVPEDPNTYADGEWVKLPGGENLSRGKDTFLGWAAAPEGPPVAVDDEGRWAMEPPAAGTKITLYAVWQPEPILQDTALKLDQTALTLAPGETARLKAALTPGDATYKYIFWTSSDEKIAAVSDSGLVTAIGEGTAAITAKSWYGHEAACTVTVKKAETPTPPDRPDQPGPWPTEGLEGFVTRCYRVALGRDPDSAGHADWVRWLGDGTVDAGSCAYGFVFSKEMNDQRLSDGDFIRTLYRLFMDREGEPEGVAFWTDYLKAGHGREEVFRGFADSAEFTRIKTSYGLA